MRTDLIDYLGICTITLQKQAKTLNYRFYRYDIVHSLFVVSMYYKFKNRIHNNHFVE